MRLRCFASLGRRTPLHTAATNSHYDLVRSFPVAQPVHPTGRLPIPLSSFHSADRSFPLPLSRPRLADSACGGSTPSDRLGRVRLISVSAGRCGCWWSTELRSRSRMTTRGEDVHAHAHARTPAQTQARMQNKRPRTHAHAYRAHTRRRTRLCRLTPRNKAGDREAFDAAVAVSLNPTPLPTAPVSTQRTAPPFVGSWRHSVPMRLQRINGPPRARAHRSTRVRESIINAQRRHRRARTRTHE